MKHQAVIITTTRTTFEFEADLATSPDMLKLEAVNALDDSTARFVSETTEERIELVEK